MFNNPVEFICLSLYYFPFLKIILFHLYVYLLMIDVHLQDLLHMLTLLYCPILFFLDQLILFFDSYKFLLNKAYLSFHYFFLILKRLFELSHYPINLFS